MTADESFKAGHLQAAIDAQIADVKSNPADAGKRLFLFELLSFAGEWDRAKRQIEAVSYPDPERIATVLKYKTLLGAEDHRTRVFRDGVMPEFLLPPPPWMSHRLQAIAEIKAGDWERASAELAKSDEAAPPVTGDLNEQPVEGLRDGDDLFGPVLEVLAQATYYWVPFEQIEMLAMNPPKTPRDLIWFPAKISLKDGPSGDVFLPTRYPMSTAGTNDSIRLGRATEWTDDESRPVRGTGLRVFLAGDRAFSLLDFREFQSR